jgi:hypothetical protein
MRPLRCLALTVGLTLLAHGMAQAQTTYKIQPLVKFGDKAGDVVIKTDGGDFEIGTLNDNGQLVFVTENEAGGEMLIQYADGKLIPIVAGGKDAPGGKWSKGVVPRSPVSMNQLGNVVFAADLTVGDNTSIGTFLWDFKAQQATTVALKGMPAVNNLTFEQGGGFAPGINNSNEIALVAQVKNAEGKAQDGVFFLGRDGKLLPVALPDQELPGGGKILHAFLPSINDTGVIAFPVRRQGDNADSGYLWEKGTITQVAVIDTDLPGGGKLAYLNGIRVNNKNRNVLVVGRLDDPAGGPDALYLFADGKLRPVAVPGQEMPGGGKFKSLQTFVIGTSFPNDAGQHAILAALEDGASAACLMDAEGKLSLILKSGTTTPLGTITNVGQGGGGSTGIGFNNKGQVALTVKIDDGLDTIVLLTP